MHDLEYHLRMRRWSEVSDFASKKFRLTPVINITQVEQLRCDKASSDLCLCLISLALQKKII